MATTVGAEPVVAVSSGGLKQREVFTDAPVNTASLSAPPVGAFGKPADAPVVPLPGIAPQGPAQAATFQGTPAAPATPEVEGALTKNHGLVVISEKVGDQRRYSIKA